MKLVVGNILVEKFEVGKTIDGQFELVIRLKKGDSNRVVVNAFCFMEKHFFERLMLTCYIEPYWHAEDFPVRIAVKRNEKSGEDEIVAIGHLFQDKWLNFENCEITSLEILKQDLHFTEVITVNF